MRFSSGHPARWWRIARRWTEEETWNKEARCVLMCHCMCKDICMYYALSCLCMMYLCAGIYMYMYVGIQEGLCRWDTCILTLQASSSFASYVHACIHILLACVHAYSACRDVVGFSSNVSYPQAYIHTSVQVPALDLYAHAHVTILDSFHVIQRDFYII